MRFASLNLIKTCPALLALALVCFGCKSEAPLQTQSSPPASPEKAPLYVLRAGGPQSYVGLNTRPESNRVTITFVGDTHNTIRYRLTNLELQLILVWNVRTQIRATDQGTDGFGWKTVHDDYPSGMNAATLPPGGVTEGIAPAPDETPWRLCILYSKEIAPNPSGRKECTGNYEVISAEIKE